MANTSYDEAYQRICATENRKLRTMTWKQITSNEWRRELGWLEKTYLLTGTAFKHTGREHWGLYTVCKVDFGEGIDGSQALRLAWKKLAIEFPGLRTTLQAEDAIHHSATDEILENWARQTFIVKPEGKADDVVAEYRSRELPALIYVPKTHEVLLLASHWRVDAIGCCMLLDRLFSLVTRNGEPECDCDPQDIELGKLSPPLEDAAGAPQIASPQIESKARQLLIDFRNKTQGTITLPYNGHSTTPPLESTYESTFLSIRSTKSLTEACKRLQVSVSAAVYTALSHALFATSPQNAADHNTSIMAANMRPYLQAPLRTEEHACQVYVSSVTASVQRNDSFETSVKTLTSSFKTWHTPQFNESLREGYRLHYGALKHILSNATESPGPQPGGVTLSSLGVVDSRLRCDHDGVVTVQDFRFGVSMLNRQMILYVWTFKGRLNLSLNYNAAYYGRETPRRILDHIQDILSSQLAIELEAEVV